MADAKRVALRAIKAQTRRGDILFGEADTCIYIYTAKYCLCHNMREARRVRITTYVMMGLKVFAPQS